MSGDPLDHMRQRIEMCRQLAKSTTDPKTAKILREMAAQGEIDLRQLLEARRVAHEAISRPEGEAR